MLVLNCFISSYLNSGVDLRRLTPHLRTFCDYLVVALRIEGKFDIVSVINENIQDSNSAN